MSLRDNEFVKKLIATSEERLTKAAADLLSNEKVMGSLQKAIGAAIEAKGLVERNVQTALSTMNIPTAGDVKKLEGKIEELEKVFEALTSKIGELQQKGAPAASAAPAAAPSAAPGAPTGQPGTGPGAEQV